MTSTHQTAMGFFIMLLGLPVLLDAAGRPEAQSRDELAGLVEEMKQIKERLAKSVAEENKSGSNQPSSGSSKGILGIEYGETSGPARR